MAPNNGHQLQKRSHIQSLGNSTSEGEQRKWNEEKNEAQIGAGAWPCICCISLAKDKAQCLRLMRGLALPGEKASPPAKGSLLKEYGLHRLWAGLRGRRGRNAQKKAKQDPYLAVGVFLGLGPLMQTWCGGCAWLEGYSKGLKVVPAVTLIKLGSSPILTGRALGSWRQSGCEIRGHARGGLSAGPEVEAGRGARGRDSERHKNKD